MKRSTHETSSSLSSPGLRGGLWLGAGLTLLAAAGCALEARPPASAPVNTTPPLDSRHRDGTPPPPPPPPPGRYHQGDHRGTDGTEHALEADQPPPGATSGGEGKVAGMYLHALRRQPHRRHRATSPPRTFAADVDTGSYSLARAYLERGALPDEAAVRVEEFVNAFDYGYRAAREGGLRRAGGGVPLAQPPRATTCCTWA